MMALSDLKDLKGFLKPFENDIQGTALWLREFIWKKYPDCNELIYDSYNAVAVGFSPTDKMGDIFVSFAVYGAGVNLGFNRGSEIQDPRKLLKGSGSLYRHLRVDPDEFPSAYINKLMADAYSNAIMRLKTETSLYGMTIVKSISPTKKRPIKKK
jgi:hypothetical protein